MLKKTKWIQARAKKTNYKNSEPSNCLSNAATMLEIYWWRGGKSLFHQKSPHRPLAFKRGRRGLNSFSGDLFIFFLLKVVLNSIQVSNSAAGCIKVPGVPYPDGSDFAKIFFIFCCRLSNCIYPCIRTHNTMYSQI